jgi:hypothetical protein
MEFKPLVKPLTIEYPAVEPGALPASAFAPWRLEALDDLSVHVQFPFSSPGQAGLTPGTWRVHRNDAGSMIKTPVRDFGWITEPLRLNEETVHQSHSVETLPLPADINAHYSHTRPVYHKERGQAIYEK